VYYLGKAYNDASSELKTILSFATSTQILTIGSGIRTLHNNYTYNLQYTCNDGFNPDSKIIHYFRVVVYDDVGSPKTLKDQPSMSMFYKDKTYKMTIDTTAFNMSSSDLTYTLKGSLNSDPINDDSYEISVAAYSSSDTSFALSHFYPQSLSDAQNGVFVEGYVKAVDTFGRIAYSRFSIYKQRNHFFNLTLYSLY
jgi:hypothetical protein